MFLVLTRVQKGGQLQLVGRWCLYWVTDKKKKIHWVTVTHSGTTGGWNPVRFDCSAELARCEFKKQASPFFWVIDRNWTKSRDCFVFCRFDMFVALVESLCFSQLILFLLWHSLQVARRGECTASGGETCCRAAGELSKSCKANLMYILCRMWKTKPNPLSNAKLSSSSKSMQRPWLHASSKSLC